MTDFLTMVGIENAASVLSFLMMFISVCAILTSLITEVLKKVPVIDKYPTMLVCYIVAAILTPSTFYAMMAFMKQPVEWFMVFASFLASFVVAKVSMNGWDDVTELGERLFRK